MSAGAIAFISRFPDVPARLRQVAQLLDSMTPSAVRLDLQTSAFERLRAEWAARPGAQVLPAAHFYCCLFCDPCQQELAMCAQHTRKGSCSAAISR